MRSVCLCVVLLATLALFPIACGVSPQIEEELKDPEKTLQVVITSEPSGAEVYGVKGNKPGTLLGTTPLVCSYMVVRSGSNPELFSNVPIGQTIVSDLNLRMYAPRAEYYTFQCVVSKEGYQAAVVQKRLDSDTPLMSRSYSTSDVFKGGQRVAVHVDLPLLDTDSTVAHMH